METINTEIIAMLQRVIKNQEDIFKRLQELKPSNEGWITPREAIKYLGISQNTFDKYRYSTPYKIEGYPLDGITLFRKKDLDSFVTSYALNSK